MNSCYIQIVKQISNALRNLINILIDFCLNIIIKNAIKVICRSFVLSAFVSATFNIAFSTFVSAAFDIAFSAFVSVTFDIAVSTLVSATFNITFSTVICAIIRITKCATKSGSVGHQINNCFYSKHFISITYVKLIFTGFFIKNSDCQGCHRVILVSKSKRLLNIVPVHKVRNKWLKSLCSRLKRLNCFFSNCSQIINSGFKFSNVVFQAFYNCFSVFETIDSLFGHPSFNCCKLCFFIF